jgi:D-alanine-D-alanine ligase
MKKELILIFGGRSGEHEVSLRTAASVYNHLDRDNYNIHLIAIDKSGIWYLQDNPAGTVESLTVDTSEDKCVSIIPMKGFLCGDREIPVDIVFPVIHGTFGEDGTLQGLLEMSGFPYVGATVGGSYLGMDKDMSKAIWEKNGIPVVPYSALRNWQYTEGKRKAANRKLIETYGLPLFVKPSMAGSSVGVSKVEKEEELSDAIIKAFLFDTKVIVEPAIKGREIECSVIGNSETESFPPGEVAPTHDFYDYEAKYIDPDGAGLIIPAAIPSEISDELRLTAEKAYKALDLKGFARVDFFLEEKSNRILLNEVNTIPGFTKISMFSMMCNVGGLPYRELLDRLISLGEEQYAERKSLRFSVN